MSSLWLDGYTKKIYLGRSGKVPRLPGVPPRIGLHFTVTGGLPNYSWPPHFTVGTAGKWQHCDLNRTSYALLSSPWVETNHAGDTNIQIEVIAMDDNWPDALYEVVSQTLADIVTAKPGMKKALLNHDRTTWARGGYGTQGPWRLTRGEWLDPYNGEPFIYAHMHVPDNSHWDTGHVDIRRLCGRALAILAGAPPAPDGWPRLLRKGDRHPKVKVLSGLLFALGHRASLIDSDYFGIATDSAVRGFQQAAGIVVDGIVGPVTRQHLYDQIADTADN